jgi:hypothetical protein
MFLVASQGVFCVVLTYQYGLRPKRQQYRRLEAILEGQRAFVQHSSRSAQPGLEQIALWSVTRIDQTTSLTTIRAFDPQGYGALPTNLSRWSLNKVDEARPSSVASGPSAARPAPALQIKA